MWYFFKLEKIPFGDLPEDQAVVSFAPSRANNAMFSVLTLINISTSMQGTYGCFSSSKRKLKVIQLAVGSKWNSPWVLKLFAVTPRGVAGNLLGVAYGFKKVDLPKKRSSFLFRDKNGKIGNLKNLFSKKLFLFGSRILARLMLKLGSLKWSLETTEINYLQWI